MASLQQMADGMFPEGAGKPKAVAKAGAAAELTNELVVNAKEAIDALWKARGYLNMKPKERKAKLGYTLDREEALGYVVTRAMHMPLLSPEEARVVEKEVERRMESVREEFEANAEQYNKILESIAQKEEEALAAEAAAAGKKGKKGRK